ncbi:MAG: hypothetical protein ABL930_13005 [Pseudobdellovibrio sp.]
MKLALLFIFAAQITQAYEGFRCIPSLRETRIQVLVKEKNIEVMVVNAGGYDFMPQFSTPSSAFGLAFNKMQAEDLKDLAEAFTFSWPKDKCELDSQNFTVNCQGEAQQKVKSVASYGVSSTQITEKYQTETYEKRRFRLAVEKDNMYFVNLEYYKQNCEKFN